MQYRQKEKKGFHEHNDRTSAAKCAHKSGTYVESNIGSGNLWREVDSAVIESKNQPILRNVG
jgi:hypothetical protein